MYVLDATTLALGGTAAKDPTSSNSMNTSRSAGVVPQFVAVAVTVIGCSVQTGVVWLATAVTQGTPAHSVAHGSGAHTA
jgi:hypothetical protein